MKLSSKRHRLKPFEVSPHDCKQSLTADLRTVIAYNRLFSHPMKLNSGSQDCKTSPCEVLLPETYAERFTFLPSSRSSVSVLSVRLVYCCSWVRKGIGSSLSRLVRTTVNSRLRLTCEPSSPITAFSHILWSWTRKSRNDVHFDKHPHDSFRVLCGVCLQWFVSKRFSSYPKC